MSDRNRGSGSGTSGRLPLPPTGGPHGSGALRHTYHATRRPRYSSARVGTVTAADRLIEHIPHEGRQRPQQAITVGSAVERRLPV